VIRVDGISRTAETPLAAVRQEIQTQLAQQKAQEAITNMVTRIEDALGGGASFEEVARAERLQIVETPPLTATGQNPDVAGWQVPPALRDRGSRQGGSGCGACAGADPRPGAGGPRPPACLRAGARVG
jgi:peptidyl-prolyl cis-trans isomerase D